MTADPYLRPSGVLDNLLGLDDAEALVRAEARIVVARELLLYRSNAVPATWNLDHVCAVHRWLFGDVYAWAGQLRSIDIVKGATRFASAEFLESAGRDLFRRRLDPRARWRSMERTRVVSECSGFLAELNLLHPFREGNGRTQRAFVQLLAVDAGWLVDWSSISPEENEAASERSIADDDAFAPLLERALRRR